jgi:hypothetical protein
MLPDAYITHATQGRVRIKIPDRKGDSTYFASLKEKLAGLSELPGIQRVEANPMTGSILVLHTLDLQATDLEMVAQYSEFNNLFRLRESLPVQRPASGRREQSLRENNGQAGSRTGSEIDPKVLAILGFVGVAIIQLKRGHIMMPAITALWYAYSLMKERQGEAAGGGK